MKVTPVVYYKKSGYPTGTDIKSRPELLKKVPHRWSGNGVVLTALGMSLALCACTARGDVEPGGVKPGSTGPGVGEPEDTGAEGAGQDYRGKTENGEAHKGLVAPVSIHGEGTGAYGCIAVTTPLFLSKGEAWEIIKSKAESYKGITFSRNTPPVLGDVKLPESRLFNGKTEEKQSLRDGGLCLDGANADNKIAFEFISQDDVYEWRKENGEVAATFTLYDTKDTAEQLREELVSYGPDIALGIFYDPCNDMDTEGAYDAMAKAEEQGMTLDWEGAKLEREARARAKSEEELHVQVRDFLDWLKGWGAI